MADLSITSAGEDIHTRSCRAAKKPNTARIAPLTRAIRMEVWTARPTMSCRFPPRFRATTTLEPTESPTNRATSRLIREVVEPTAARDSFPANRPTTMTSAALNNSCSILEAIRGIANSRILSAREP